MFQRSFCSRYCKIEKFDMSKKIPFYEVYVFIIKNVSSSTTHKKTPSFLLYVFPSFRLSVFTSFRLSEILREGRAPLTRN